MSIKKVAAVICGLGLAALTLPAQAAWPERQVNVIVPFTAGGTTDVVARLITDKLRAKFNVPFIIDNRPGAGGNIGVQAAATAKPDGYTIVVGTISTHAINPILGDVPFDIEKDFTPVGALFEMPNILFVKSGLGIETTQELIDHLKANPGKLFLGSTGPGSSQYIAGELLQAKTGTQIKHVTYKGAGDIMTALVGGHLDMAFNTATASTAFLDNENVRALGVSSLNRISVAPNLPTLAETIPDFETGAWAGIWAPTGTPQEAIDTLSAALEEILATPELKEAGERLGTIPLIKNSADFTRYASDERKKWAEVLKKPSDAK